MICFNCDFYFLLFQNLFWSCQFCCDFLTAIYWQFVLFCCNFNLRYVPCNLYGIICNVCVIFFVMWLFCSRLHFSGVCSFLSEQGPKAHTRSSHSRPCWRWVLCYHYAPEHMWNIMWTPLPSRTLKGGPWLVMPWIFLLSAYEGCSHLYYLRAPAEAVEPCTVCLLDWFLVKRISLHELLSDGSGALDQ